MRADTEFILDVLGLTVTVWGSYMLFQWVFQ